MRDCQDQVQRSSTFDFNRTWACSTLNERVRQTHYEYDKFKSIGGPL